MALLCVMKTSILLYEDTLKYDFWLANKELELTPIPFESIPSYQGNLLDFCF